MFESTKLIKDNQERVVDVITVIYIHERESSASGDCDAIIREVCLSGSIVELLRLFTSDY